MKWKVAICSQSLGPRCGVTTFTLVTRDCADLSQKATTSNVSDDTVVQRRCGTTSLCKAACLGMHDRSACFSHTSQAEHMERQSYTLCSVANNAHACRLHTGCARAFITAVQQYIRNIGSPMLCQQCNLATACKYLCAAWHNAVCSPHHLVVNSLLICDKTVLVTATRPLPAALVLGGVSHGPPRRHVPPGLKAVAS